MYDTSTLSSKQKNMIIANIELQIAIAVLGVIRENPSELSRLYLRDVENYIRNSYQILERYMEVKNER